MLAGSLVGTTSRPLPWANACALRPCLPCSTTDVWSAPTPRSMFEVDGKKSKVYCQNLCLLSKLFLVSCSRGPVFRGLCSGAMRVPMRAQQGWGLLACMCSCEGQMRATPPACYSTGLAPTHVKVLHTACALKR